jgi:hypothetical protein
MGAWQRFTIEFEPQDGTDIFRFYFGASPQPVLTLTADPAPGASALVIGARGSGVPIDLDVSIDNVLVTTF